MLLSCFFKLGLDVSLVFSKCVEFTYILCKFVVKLSEFLALDFVNLALEYCGLACKIFSIVIFGECYVYVEFFINILAYNLFFKTGNESAAADFKAEVFCLAAFKSLAVTETFKIENNCIAVFSSSVSNVDNSCILVSYTFNICVNICVSNSLDSFFYL